MSYFCLKFRKTTANKDVADAIEMGGCTKTSMAALKEKTAIGFNG